MAVIVPYTSEVAKDREYPPPVASQYFANTCSECPSRGLLDIAGDYVSIGTDEVPKMLVVGFPDRCKPCGASHKRFGRAKKAIRKVTTAAVAYDMRPKMVTIGLPSKWIPVNSGQRLDESLRSRISHCPYQRGDYEYPAECSSCSREDENPITVSQLRELFITHSESEMKLLKRRYREAKPTITSFRFKVKGGHDFFECTWKVQTADNENYSYTTAEASHNPHYLLVRRKLPDDEFGPYRDGKSLWTEEYVKTEDIVAIKVHAHVHGIWASPWIDQDKLNLYLETMNLGRADLRSSFDPIDPEKWLNKQAGYLSKYLSKENRFRSTPWGICRAPFDY